MCYPLGGLTVWNLHTLVFGWVRPRVFNWRWIDKSISQQNFQMVKGADKLFHKSWMVCDRATFPDFEFFSCCLCVALYTIMTFIQMLTQVIIGAWPFKEIVTKSWSDANPGDDKTSFPTV